MTEREWGGEERVWWRVVTRVVLPAPWMPLRAMKKGVEEDWWEEVWLARWLRMKGILGFRLSREIIHGD